MNHVMLDLETLGLNVGSMILSIGAVKFDPVASKLGDEFHMRIAMEDSQRYGFGMDVSTIRWWLQQSEAAKKEALSKEKALEVREVLARFFAFCTSKTTAQIDKLESREDAEEVVEVEDVKMWGNGAAFDNVLLSHYYTRTGILQPWKFYNDRCYRTIKSLAPEIKLTRIGVHHNALDDAKSQAAHLCEIARIKRIQL